MPAFSRYGRYFDGGAGLALAVLVLLAVLIFPVPTIMLDVGISMSLTVAIILFVTSLTIKTALDLSTLPSLLLLTTIFRLLLNVATSRQILSNTGAGEYAAGKVVAAFGGLLMRGDVIVGLIVFCVLITVNFTVISKGLGRVAEVSARFHLDSLPGKQMAIDADLSSGMIDEAGAQRRRAELEKQGGFYSAMDGASKFIKGDAICTLVMAVINIFGGIVIGIVQGGLSLQDAVSTYTTLTVGDGLVSQLPAILVSLAAGIVVSKGATGERLQDDLVGQMRTSSPALLLASGVATVAALIAGLPLAPMLTLLTTTGGLAWRHFRPVKIPPASAPAAAASNADPPPPTMDQLRIELGYSLLELVGTPGKSIPEQIKKLRQTLTTELGFVLPSVRIQDNMNLSPNQYVFMVKEVRAGSGDLQPINLLAISPGDGATPIPGDATVEPTFGLPARWIAPANADMARAANWTVVDPATVMITHLAEVVKENMADLFTYADAQKLINELPQQQQKLANDLIPGLITVGHLQRVLQALLAERVSIRDLPTILEAVHEACSGNVKSIPAIVAQVRVRLSRQICESLAGNDGYIPLITLSSNWEDTMTDSMTGPPEDRQLALGSERLRELINSIRTATESAIRAGIQPALVSGQHLRAQLHAIVDRARINIPVIAHSEIHRRAKVKMVGTI